MQIALPHLWYGDAFDASLQIYIESGDASSYGLSMTGVLELLPRREREFVGHYEFFIFHLQFIICHLIKLILDNKDSQIYHFTLWNLTCRKNILKGTFP